MGGERRTGPGERDEGLQKTAPQAGWGPGVGGGRAASLTFCMCAVSHPLGIGHRAREPPAQLLDLSQCQSLLNSSGLSAAMLKSPQNVVYEPATILLCSQIGWVRS